MIYIWSVSLIFLPETETIQVDAGSTEVSYADVAHSSVPSRGDTDTTPAGGVAEGSKVTPVPAANFSFNWQKSLVPYEYLEGILSTFP